ncbi:hypothetical protein [Marinigracilibium pacificum]|uniref:Long-subunit fatty acid transport protein n=1 Tax=Marinigracilibium pacificum TaxID=2729599 RepID=A0A848IZ80_9BACT|nr:hypothetical protein [Marinigracilibium pacificum]NMM47524.1 hypothetical protein [Marinigracilibium pacificum]
MMKINRSLFVCFICWLCAFVAHGQQYRSSVYSGFGIGEIKYPSTSYFKSMGGTSIGVTSKYHVNLDNPAANTYLGGESFQNQFDIGFYINNRELKSEEISGSLTDGGLAYVNFWTRFNSKWTGMVGITPISLMGYDVMEKDVQLGNGDRYDLNYVGSGGFSKAYLAMSYEVFKGLTLGGRLGYIFGSLSQEEKYMNEAGYALFTLDSRTTVNRLNFDISMNYQYQFEKSALNFGAIYETKVELKGTNITELSDEIDEYTFDRGESYTSLTIPEQIGIGLSYQNELLIVGLDVMKMGWENVSSSYPEISLRDSYRYSIGISYLPTLNPDTFFHKIRYSAGGYINQSHLIIEGVSFVDYGVSAGISIPVNNAIFDFYYNRAINGTTTKGLVQESVHELGLSISFKGRWMKTRYY